MNRHRLPQATLALLSFATLTAALAAQGTPIGFEETYALAADRRAAVATLIPGTDDWYYYSCRERLDARDFASVQQLLGPWVQRHGRNARVIEIENREALLNFAAAPERAYTLLAQRLGVTFPHQREVPGTRSDLPTRLDAALLSPSALRERALQRHPGTVDGFDSRALAALCATDLTADQLHSLLARLDRPDVDNLPALVVRDLAHPQSRGFGSLPVHRELRLAQLEECVRLQPALLQQPAFVQAFLTRLQPDGDTAWQDDPAARAAQLGRLWAFAQRLAPQFNSLKAHVLYHWLQHDLSQGAPDKERFLAYLRLPRRGGHAAEGHLRRHQDPQAFVDPGREQPTGLPRIGDDTPLVRACLEHFFAAEDGYEAYAEFLDADWLRAVLAETKLMLGQGDAERWYSLRADPAALEQLERRVEIVFPPTLRQRYAPSEPVALEVDVKNVPTLLVKVFAIDSYRYHIETQREIDASIPLDGVVANVEQTHRYAEPPVRRVRRRFELPMLQQPGTYVVEFVGNGISSRAVVHKGGLRAVERHSAAGHLFRVHDEAGNPLPDASAWFGGREYAADQRGEILVPFASEAGRKKLVVRHGNRSALVEFAHRAERYELHAGSHVEREALVAGRTARLLLRPELRLDGAPVALSLLQDPVLVLVATDLDGRSTPQEVRGLQLASDRELVHEFRVPERLQQLQVALRGKVKTLAGPEVELTAATASYEVNRMDRTAATAGLALVRTAAGYALEMRGKDGEPKAGRTLRLRLAHADYRDPIEAELQTDAAGRADLGALPGIVSLHVQHGEHGGNFVLPRPAVARPDALHGLAGATLRLPYRGAATAVSRAHFGLLSLQRDEFARLALVDGCLELRGLPAGDYELHLHETGEVIPVRVTAGRADGEWLVGAERTLQAAAATPLHLRDLAVDGDALVVRLANAGPGTRVHAVATRHVPQFDLFAHLRGAPRPPLVAADAPLPSSSYEVGRQLGDEFRYVLERRFATRFPGNMLGRPSLLVHPWQLPDATSSEPIGLGGGRGGRYGGRAGGRRAQAGQAKGGGGGGELPDLASFANFDWLPAAAATVANRAPDQDGVVRIPLAELGAGHLVHVLAVDGGQAVRDTLVRAEAPVQPRPRSLPQALDGQQHFAEQKRIEFVAAGAEANLGDPRSGAVELFDSLDAVYRALLAIRRDDADLPRFAFLVEWPTLSPERQRELYAQHACHELHFFLHQKDPAFFAAVIKPLLADKRAKTFLDRWLLGEDLRGFLDPWRFAQLNLIEKVLLAQRLGDAERQTVARLLQEQLELRPPQPERRDELFDLALGSQGLDEQQSLHLGALVQDAGRPAGPTTGGAEPGYRGPGDRMPPLLGAAPVPAAPARTAPGAPAEAETADKDLQAEAGEALERRKAEAKADDKPAGDARARENAAALPKLRAEGEKLKDEAAARGWAAALFQPVLPTKMHIEHDYWHRTPADTRPDVVAANQFWLDYATAPAGQPFVSAALLEASGSLLESLFALAVLDLPFAAGKHDLRRDGEQTVVRAATPLLLVRKQVAPVEPAAGQPQLLLGENFFRLDDRYRLENGERRDAFVSGEFLTDVAYGCQVVVTNPTSSKRVTQLLLQVPAGAVPVQGGFWTRGVTVELPPYATKAIEYAFYFPAPGDFAHYPAHAAERGKLAAAAAPRTLAVRATATAPDTASWYHVSQLGTAAEVLAFVDRHNAQQLDLGKVAWRMHDRAFAQELLARLRARHVFDPVLWSYGLLHRDATATREWLAHQEQFVASCGRWLRSPLLDVDPVERKQYQHVEFDPLVNARAHRLGGQRRIANTELAAQYQALLQVLGYVPQLGAEDWLAVTYHLLLQDRIDEALAAFAKVEPGKVAERVQYDYLAAYLCFFTADTAKARQLAERHRDHPVAHWQKRFRDVLAQLDEAEGRTPAATDPGAAAQAALAPSLELALDGRTVRIAHRNLAACEVRYYPVDVEFAFSARPFADADGGAAAYVQPALATTVELPKDRAETAFALPERFAQQNVLVEVRGGGLVRARTFVAASLGVRFLESYGQLVATEAGADKPLPKAYVKVFARLDDGTVRFHKDGYTDLRGRFDYVSVSDEPRDGTNRYAVLVLHEERGAVIREVAPPQR